MLKRFALLLIVALATLPALSGCGYNQIQKNEEASLPPGPMSKRLTRDVAT